VERLLTPQQLSELLQVKLSTVYKWTHYEYVPYIKLHGLRRFRVSNIEKWLDKKDRQGRKTYKIAKI